MPASLSSRSMAMPSRWRLVDALERDALVAQRVEQLEQVGQRAGEAVQASRDGKPKYDGGYYS